MFFFTAPLSRIASNVKLQAYRSCKNAAPPRAPSGAKHSPKPEIAQPGPEQNKNARRTAELEQQISSERHEPQTHDLCSGRRENGQRGDNKKVSGRTGTSKAVRGEARCSREAAVHNLQTKRLVQGGPGPNFPGPRSA